MTFLDLDREKDGPPGQTSARLVERPPQAAPDPAHLAGKRWQTVATRARRPSEDIAVLDRICLHDRDDYVLLPVRSVLVARSDNGVTTVEPRRARETRLARLPARGLSPSSLCGGGEPMTFVDLYREKYERRGGSAEQFVEAYLHADPEKVVDYLLEHHPESVRAR